MVLLDENKIKELIKKPKRSADIQKAVAYEERLRMHTEKYLSVHEVGAPISKFFSFVGSLIPPDKLKTFKSLISFPLLTTPIVEDAYSQLRRVYDSKDTTERYIFENTELNQDWGNYRQRVLKDPERWSEESWDAVKNNICSILVCDLPKEQTTERPAPYSYFLNIGNVIDFGYADGAITHIIFKTSERTAVVIDSGLYRTYKVDSKKDAVLLSESEHGLGYCPAQFFWSDTLTKSDVARRSSRIASQLGNLDWMLFFGTSKKHLDTYASYPIYSAYEADCDYSNNDTGSECDGGYLRNPSGDYETVNGFMVRCPKCADKSLAGAGSMIEIPIPSKDEDVPDLRNPVTLTSIDKDSLEYNVNEVNRLEKNILNNIVGTSGVEDRKEAVNEKQIRADFEGRTTVLRDLKINLEKAYKFKNDTICRLRYGDAYLGSVYNMGDEFYIYSAVELRDQYTKAKEQGASQATLDNLDEKIIQTEHRNDVSKLQRMQILRHLEPYRHYTLKEVVELKKEGLTNEDELKLKVNFSSLIERFERENGDIINFGKEKTFFDKINLIKSALNGYGRE